MTSPSHLYDQYWNELCRVIRRKFGSGPPDPEEGAQVAFERLTIVSRSVQIDNPRAFLHRCARNYVLNEKRHHSVQRRYAEEFMATNLDEGADEFDAQRVLEAKERLSVVIAAVQGLDERRRKVLLLRQIDELSFAEIAQVMQLSRARVMQLFAEALLACARAARTVDVSDAPAEPRQKKA